LIQVGVFNDGEGAAGLGNPNGNLDAMPKLVVYRAMGEGRDGPGLGVVNRGATFDVANEVTRALIRPTAPNDDARMAWSRVSLSKYHRDKGTNLLQAN
jgi:hypothetical protein